MTTVSLTPAQHAILAYALAHNAGRITWFPDNIKGGARTKVLAGLASRALIAQDGAEWLVADAGYDAMGHARPAPAPIEADPELEAVVTAAEAEWAKAPPAQRRSRDNSKQAQVIAMLKRPEGATISQLCAATGWQHHTVRGTFAGALKKKLGLALVSDKPQGSERVYRISQGIA